MKDVMKQALLIGGLTLLATAFSGGILFVGATAKFVPNTLTSDAFIPYNMTDLRTETERDTNAGLPITNISFQFGDDEDADDEVSSEGFSALRTAIEERINTEPVLYNVTGTSDTNNFTFKSVSPSDYMDDTFTNTYRTFSSLANNNDGHIEFSSVVDETGTRHVNITATQDETATDGFSLERTWTELMNTPTLAGETYNITYIGNDGLHITASFTTKEERDNILNTHELVWDTLAKIHSDYRSKYSIQTIAFNISTAGNNQSTVALTISDPGDRAKYVQEFTDEATKDPDVVLPWELTITLTVAEETTPFQIFYPSNREW